MCVYRIFTSRLQIKIVDNEDTHVIRAHFQYSIHYDVKGPDDVTIETRTRSVAEVTGSRRSLLTKMMLEPDKRAILKRAKTSIDTDGYAYILTTHSRYHKDTQLNLTSKFYVIDQHTRTSTLNRNKRTHKRHPVYYTSMKPKVRDASV